MNYNVYHFFLALVLVCSFVTASTFQFLGSNDNIDISEEMGDVLQSVSASELSELKSGTVKTKQGTTKFNQYLRFSDSSTAIASPTALLDKSEEDEVTEFLKVAEGSAVTDAFFEYHLEFEDSLESKVKENALSSLDGSKVFLFDEEYIIVEGIMTDKKVNLMFASGAIEDLLRSSETKEYTIDGNKYELSIKTIETSTKSVIFTLNGKDLQKLVKAETIDIGNGLTLGVTDVLTSSGGNDLVEFFIGAKVFEFEDTNYEDNSFNRGVRLNKQQLSDSFIKISATLVNDVLKISDIKYRAITKVDIHAKAGETIGTHLGDPRLLLGNWDIAFAGMSNPTKKPIAFNPSGGSDEYTLTFENADGKTLSIPFISNKVSFKLGDSDQDLIFVEGSSQTDYNIDQNDYFVLTTSNTKTGKTYVVKYDSIDKGSQTLQFTSLTEGTKSVTYTNGTAGILGQGTLNVGSATAKVYIQDGTGNPLAIDQNGDGDVGSDEMNLITAGGGILDMGSSNALAGSTHAITLTTDSSQFEESSTSETTTITFDTTAGTPIDIQSAFTGLTTHNDNNNHVLGLTDYGAKFDLDDRQGKAGILTITYPTLQMFALVSLQASPAGSTVQTNIKTISVTTCSNGQQDGDETGVDCGGSCPNVCATCSDGKQNQDEEGIDCGGSCPNSCAPGETTQVCEGCLQTLEGGKTQCLAVGDVVKKRYCATDQSLKAQKKNRQTCEFAYECLSGVCEEGKCGKKIGAVKIVINIILLVAILGIFWYGFSLLKK